MVATLDTAVPAYSLASLDAPKQKRVSVLGATGSVGTSALDLIRQSPDRFAVEAVTANTNVEALAKVALEFEAAEAVIADENLFEDLKERLAGSSIIASAGRNALNDAAARSADVVVAGIVGSAGLAPSMSALREGTALALANKECLVCAGELFMGQAARSDATILPIDSEHNAIFQVLDRDNRSAVETLILTASGGPFRTASKDRMAAVSPSDALAHPTWSMGAKISIDSATMMNKGMEIIEAHYLFDMPASSIDVVVHPQSIIHSMVAYSDGSVLAQLGCPDMRIPIAHALAYPDRLPTKNPRLDLTEIGQLTFEPPDLERFPSLSLARQALEAQGGAPTVLNAANEVAVARFLNGRIGFMAIPAVVEETMSKIESTELFDVDSVVALDADARRVAGDIADSPLFCN